MAGSGCIRRGYRTFLRLLYEITEVTEYRYELFESVVESVFTVRRADERDGDEFAVWNVWLDVVDIF